MSPPNVAGEGTREVADQAAGEPIHAGSLLVSERFENGTVGAIGLTHAKEPRIITAAHVLGGGQAAFASDDGKTLLGKCEHTVNSLTGRQLYGASARNAEEAFCVDTSSAVPTRGLRLRGGLVGGAPFGTEPAASLVEWILGAAVCSYGARSQTWRTGTVIQLFPRRIDDGLTGFCLVAEHGPVMSHPGDSGSLWVAERGDTHIAIGLHWGEVDLDSTPHTFVTDLESALPWLGLSEIVGDPHTVFHL